MASCSTAPSLHLPLFEQVVPSVPSMNSSLESRLLALRSRVEAGEHKHAVPTEWTEDGKRRSVLSATKMNERPVFATPPLPSLNNSNPLKTPSTPGKRKRPTPSCSDMPTFLPVGLAARTRNAPLSRKTQLAAAEIQTSSSPKRARIEPRFDCAWLAALGPPPLASITVDSGSDEQAQSKTASRATVVDTVDAPQLMETLETAVRMMDPSRSAGDNTVPPPGTPRSQRLRQSIGHASSVPLSSLSLPLTPGLKISTPLVTLPSPSWRCNNALSA